MNQQLEEVLGGAANPRVRSALSEVLENSQWDRGADRRIPYFGPVAVSLPYALEINLSAFVRDLSAGGIGLVHLMPIDPSEVVIKLALPSRREVAFKTELLWCRDYGNGWYASGGRIVDVIG